MKESLTHIRTIVYGGTFLALGIAMRDPEHTLILEPNALAGHEYIDAMRLDDPVREPARSPFGRALWDEAVGREIQDEQGRIHTPALTSPLMLLIRRFGLRILFSSPILSVREEEEGVLVRTVCQNNQSSYLCERFVDTTSDIPRLKGAGVLRGVSLNAMMALNGRPVPAYDRAGVRAVPGRFAGSFVLEFSVDAQDGFAAHRVRIVDFMRSLPEELSGAQLLTAANTLCVRAQELPVGEGRLLFAPSCAQPNLYAALERGYELGGALQ